MTETVVEFTRLDDIGIRSAGKKNSISSKKTNRLIWICIDFHLLFPIPFQFANQWPNADQRGLFASISAQVYGQRDFCIIAGGCRTWCRHGGHKGMGGIVVMKFILVTDHLRQGGCCRNGWLPVSLIFLRWVAQSLQDSAWWYHLAASWHGHPMLQKQVEVMMGRQAASWLASRWWAAPGCSHTESCTYHARRLAADYSSSGSTIDIYWHRYDLMCA